MTVYSVPEIMAHMKATGLDFHAASADLTAARGPDTSPRHACAGCGEVINREPDALCGACLFDED
jgi:hypothetical protein